MMIVWANLRISLATSTGSPRSPRGRQRSSISALARATTAVKKACWPG